MKEKHVSEIGTVTLIVLGRNSAASVRLCRSGAGKPRYGTLFIFI